jgi:phage/plasmid primase-like uncharacterized protein
MKKAGVLLGTTSVVLVACAQRDHFPMDNPKTGQQVACVSGDYSFGEGLPQVRIAEQCMRACARYGFKLTDRLYADRIRPAAPDDDVKPYIPEACLP